MTSGLVGEEVAYMKEVRGSNPCHDPRGELTQFHRIRRILTQIYVQNLR